MQNTQHCFLDKHQENYFWLVLFVLINLSLNKSLKSVDRFFELQIKERWVNLMNNKH